MNILNIPKTVDGTEFFEGLEIWFMDTRLAHGLNGWVEYTKRDGLTLVNGFLRFDGYEWCIDKGTSHNRDLCQPWGGEKLGRYFPNHYAGIAIKEVGVWVDKKKVKPDA